MSIQEITRKASIIFSGVLNRAFEGKANAVIYKMTSHMHFNPKRIEHSAGIAILGTSTEQLQCMPQYQTLVKDVVTQLNMQLASMKIPQQIHIVDLSWSTATDVEISQAISIQLVPLSLKSDVVLAGKEMILFVDFISDEPIDFSKVYKKFAVIEEKKMSSFEVMKEHLSDLAIEATCSYGANITDEKIVFIFGYLIGEFFEWVSGNTLIDDDNLIM